MVFSSLVFLCVFFPLQMLVYYLARDIEARNTVLILFSLVFYAWGEPFFIVLLVFMCFVDWGLSQFIYKYRGTGKSRFFRHSLLSLFAAQRHEGICHEGFACRGQKGKIRTSARREKFLPERFCRAQLQS